MCSSYNLLHLLFFSFFFFFFLISSCIVFGRLPKHVVVAQFSGIDQKGRTVVVVGVLWGGGSSQQNKEHVQTSRARLSRWSEKHDGLAGRTGEG